MNTFKKGKGLTSLDEARNLIQAHIKPLEGFSEEIPSHQGVSLILAEDIYADADMPNYRKSTMDGYAMRLENDNKRAVYKLVGEQRMGSPDTTVLEQGTAVYVPTGGRMPENANALIKVEGIEVIEDSIRILDDSHIGPHWIEKGEDIKAGVLAICAGTRVTTMHLGFLSLLGKETIKVKKRLKVAIITTGDELVPSFAHAPLGKIRDINQVVLRGLIEANDAQVVYGQLIEDDRDKIETALLEAVGEADLVITSGASSMGKADVIPELLEQHADQGLIFHGLNIKPGKPVGLCTIKGKPVLALPGNPVSSAMTWIVVGEVVQGQLTGYANSRIRTEGILETTCSSQEGKCTFIPVKCILENGKQYARPIFGKSGMISIVAAADGFIEVAPNEVLESGKLIEITLF